MNFDLCINWYRELRNCLHYLASFETVPFGDGTYCAKIFYCENNPLGTIYYKPVKTYDTVVMNVLYFDFDDNYHDNQENSLFENKGAIRRLEDRIKSLVREVVIGAFSSLSRPKLFSTNFRAVFKVLGTNPHSHSTC